MPVYVIKALKTFYNEGEIALRSTKYYVFETTAVAIQQCDVYWHGSKEIISL